MNDYFQHNPDKLGVLFVFLNHLSALSLRSPVDIWLYLWSLLANGLAFCISFRHWLSRVNLLWLYRRSHICAHTGLIPHDFAQTSLCPDAYFVPWHVIVKLRNIPVEILLVIAEQNFHCSLYHVLLNLKRGTFSARNITLLIMHPRPPGRHIGIDS